MNVCQAAVDTIAAEGELGMIDAELVENRCMNVVNGRGMATIQGLVSPLITFAYRGAAFDPTAAQPVSKAVGIVVSTFASLRTWHPPEFCGPQDEGVLEQSSLF